MPVPTRERAAERRAAALAELFDEVRLFFHRMRAVAAHVHGQGEESGGRRGVLRELARLGPRTVPEMARARPVSRQHIQSLVNGLVDDGLVEIAPNPAHRRSGLVRATERGRALVAEMERREARVLGTIGVAPREQELRAAAALLRSLRSLLADTDWPALVERVAPEKRRTPR
jgi:DNA-binding MarR family transcriptional regulator